MREGNKKLWMIYFLTQSALKANAVDNTSWAWYIDLSTARLALRVSPFCLAAVGLQIEKYKILTSSKTVRFSQAP